LLGVDAQFYGRRPLSDLPLERVASNPCDTLSDGLTHPGSSGRRIDIGVRILALEERRLVIVPAFPHPASKTAASREVGKDSGRGGSVK
jgi:hypothetical protein